MARPKAFNPDTVLEEAIGLFSRHGYHGTSLSMLVSHLGINRASIYDTFGDKEKLYGLALERYAANWPVPAAAEKGSRAVAQVQEGLESSMARCHADRKARGCFLLKAAAEDGPESTRTVVKKYFTTWERFFQKSLEKGTRRKAAARRNAKDDAKFLVGQVYALHGMSLLSTDRKAGDKLIAEVLALVA